MSLDGPSSTADAVPRETEPSAGLVADLFGERAPLAHRYVELLGTSGVERGLIGPREVPRLWQRHVLNCAVVAELVPPGASVIDVGSGAGLPGIPLALARPDLTIVLLEPLLRRTVWLGEVLDELALPGVSVVRDRAETARAAGLRAAVVTARAVAPLDRLAGWCLPLLEPGGVLLALKGATAAEELAATADQVRALGASELTLALCGADRLAEPTSVVVVRRSAGAVPPVRGKAAARARGAKRR